MTALCFASHEMSDLINNFDLGTVSSIVGQVTIGLGSLVGAYFTVRRYGRAFITSVKVAFATVIVGAMMLLGYTGSRLYQAACYDSSVKEYVVAAYQTNDKGKAHKYLSEALAYLEKTGRHKGHSAIFAGGHQDDLEEWTGDLRKVRDDLDTSNNQVVTTALTSPEEVTEHKQPRWRGMLNSLRLVTQNGEGDAVFHAPTGASLAPFNLHYFLWLLTGLTLTGTGIGWVSYSVRHKKQATPRSCKHCGAAL